MTIFYGVVYCCYLQNDDNDLPKIKKSLDYMLPFADDLPTEKFSPNSKVRLAKAGVREIFVPKAYQLFVQERSLATVR